MNRNVSYLASRIMDNAHFIYTAFAPMCANSRAKLRMSDDDAEHILVKIGISVVPMNRIVCVHHNSPFRVSYAAFTPTFSAKRKAEKIESRILKAHVQYRTRGEWLMLPNNDETKKEFASKSRAIIYDMTGKPVKWVRVTGADIAKYAVDKMIDVGG